MAKTEHPTAAAASSDVIDWIRRQAVSSSASDVAQQQICLPLPAVPPPPNGQSQEGGELFDSGTESGEDSTTQSNHSQSDLNSFMANLAKLSLDPPQVPASVPIPAAQDFLRQVDSVLGRLKTSLQPDEGAEFKSDSSADHQEVLHQHLASGGLDRQWRIHPQQQSELINLIDRLQSSLHTLQSSPPAPAPDPLPAAAQSADGSKSVAAPKPTNPVKDETKTEPTKPANVSSPATPSPATTKSGITSVKLRAKTFTNPPEAPPSRPNSFLRASWRSSSEPTTPSPSPSPTPTPTPPPKIHWRAPDFLTNTTSTPPASHRPIWCRDNSASAAAASTTPAKIVLEKSGIRGRFVQPELNPAPVITPKIPTSVRLPIVSLKSPSSPPVSGTQTPPQLKLQEPAVIKPIIQLERSSPVQQQPEKPEQPEQEAENDPVGGRNKKTTSNVPWKVKLAKKRAERSQTSVGLDGQVSVDLRKSIQLAAHRKSLEDIRQPEESRKPEEVKPSQPELYPLLKQKSLGELYAPKPKPFLRSESVGAAPPPIDSVMKKINWGSRSSSLDRASDLSSAPQTPLSPDPPSPVISCAIAPSKSGHNWVLSMSSSSRKEEKKKEPVVEEEPAPSVVVVPPEKIQPEATESKEIEEGDSEDEEAPEEVVTGVLKLPPKEAAPPVDEPVPPPPLQRQTSSDLKTDPSEGLFTPAESLQIAIHKAAIKASLSRQISERDMPSSPDCSSKSHPLEAKTHPQLNRTQSAPKVTPPPFKAVVPPSEVKPDPPPVENVVPESKPTEVKAAVPQIQIAADEPEAEANPVPMPVPFLEPEAIKKAMAPLPSWKERARRCNTIAFSGPASSSTPFNASGNKFQWRPVQAPAAALTENDRKFQNLFQKATEQSGGRVGFQARPLPADPAGGGMWTNKFSNIRTSFESRPSSTATTPTQSRSRRSSADDNSQTSSVTSGQLQFQLTKPVEAPKTNHQQT